MNIVIKGFDKPKSCLSCPFNQNDCLCSITHGGIDRDDYSCDEPCPIKSFDNILDEIRAEIEYHRRKIKSIDPYDLVGDCLDIIDKYKAESENKK